MESRRVVFVAHMPEGTQCMVPSRRSHLPYERWEDDVPLPVLVGYVIVPWRGIFTYMNGLNVWLNEGYI